MSNRPARITQSEITRVIRAAKQAGASEVVVKVGDQDVVVKLSTDREKALEQSREIIL